MLARLGRHLPALWSRRGALSRVLLPLSWLYGALVWLRSQAYRLGIRKALTLPVPVLVVGNVVAGGTGKTPVVVALVRHLRSRGWTPGVLARGHGRSVDAILSVDAQRSANEVGDEPAMVWRITGAPVFVGRNRPMAGQALLAQCPHVDILVSDDGLQHLALGRTIEIGVSGAEGIGNGWLLPAGPLREPWPRAFDLLLDAGSLDARHRHVMRRRLSGTAMDASGNAVALESLRHTHGGAPPSIWAVAAIAHPQRFFAMLGEAGIALQGTIALHDHAPIRMQDIAMASGSLLLCTDKDADKVWALRPDARAVGLALDIDPAFWAALDDLLASRTGRSVSSSHGHPTA